MIDVTPAEPADRDGIPRSDGRSVHRAVDVLEYVASRAAGPAPGVLEIARAVGREKSVVSRNLRTLAEIGLLARDPVGLGYRVGPLLYRLASAAQDARLLELGERSVSQLADEFGERSEVYTRTGNLAMTIATASPDSPLQVAGWPGRTYPLAGTAAGRALLLDTPDADVLRLVQLVGIGAEGPNAPRSTDDLLTRLDTDRRAGVVLSVEEVDRDLTAIACPIRAGRGRVVASLVVSGPRERLSPRLDRIGLQLRVHAAMISTALGDPRSHVLPLTARESDRGAVE